MLDFDFICSIERKKMLLQLRLIQRSPLAGEITALIGDLVKHLVGNVMMAHALDKNIPFDEFTQSFFPLQIDEIRQDQTTVLEKKTFGVGVAQNACEWLTSEK